MAARSVVIVEGSLATAGLIGAAAVLMNEGPADVDA